MINCQSITNTFNGEIYRILFGNKILKQYITQYNNQMLLKIIKNCTAVFEVHSFPFQWQILHDTQLSKNT